MPARDLPARDLPRPDRCAVLGIVNVTADSFSDGGRHLDVDLAVRHGLRLHADGADLVDVGGESTRPGAARVDPADETARVVPVVRALAAEGVAVSVDTMRAQVAAAALDAGAVLVNDVSGGLADPAMARLVADAGCPWILMHWVSADGFAGGAGGRSFAPGADVVTEVREHLARRAEAAVAAGVAPERIVLDPGLGFAKDAADNWALLRGLDRLIGLGHPVLVAASRKRFLGQTLAAESDGKTDDRSDGRHVGEPRPVDGRDAATHAVSALAAAAGAWGVRVHEVAATLDAVRVAAAWEGTHG